jgi:hypothetical protein
MDLEDTVVSEISHKRMNTKGFLLNEASKVVIYYFLSIYRSRQQILEHQGWGWGGDIGSSCSMKKEL